MTVTNTTHLNFRGQAREALEFYHSVFGGSLTAITFAQMGAAEDPAEADQIMWGQVEAPNGFRIMAFDVPSARAFDRGTESFFESLRGTDIEEITALWARLAEGASVRVPLAPAQWSPIYGMLTDRFGITWVVDAAADQAA
ncbi:VOC family protein [Frondihabitans cladoniiphilus]